MSMKLKALGLALVAAMAVGAFGAANASATGHFVTEVHHTILTGSQVAEYTGRFAHGETEIECKTAELDGTLEGTTFTSVKLTPTISGCRLAALPGVAVTVTHNGCNFEATIGTKSTTHNKVHLVCPEGSPGIVLHWSIFLVGNCTVTFKPQPAAGGGVVYHTGGVGKTHDILATITTSGSHVVYQQSGLGCAGTNGTVVGGTVAAEATISGEDTDKNPVGITATGSED